MEFRGYERPDGSVGVRNWVVVISANNCSNELAATIAEGVYGVVPILHNLACSRLKPDQQRGLSILTGLGSNPNVAGVVVAGIGCEAPSAQEICDGIRQSGKRAEAVTVEATGQFDSAVELGRTFAREMATSASLAVRQAYDISHLVVGVKCGGSSTLSPLAAHASAGGAVDALVAAGGTAIFSETAEVIGAEQVLAQRAKNEDVANRFLEIVKGWEQLIRDCGVDIRGSEPTPGNIRGGLTTLEEKSLGAITKIGTSKLDGVLEHGEKPKGNGLFFMDSPSATTQILTGMAAAGVQVLVFSFGGGLPTKIRSLPAAVGGLPILPVVKVFGNPNDKSEMEYFDLYAGGIIEGTESIDLVSSRLFGELCEVASGKSTKSELHSTYSAPLDLDLRGPVL